MHVPRREAPARILVAEDDRDARDGLVTRLAQAGFDVVSAGDGEAAIRMFDARQPGAAVLDIKMPGIDGLGVCEHIRRTGSQIPVFLLTGAEEGVIRNHLTTLKQTVRGDYIVTKPYDGKALVLMIWEALARFAAEGSTEERAVK